MKYELKYLSAGELLGKAFSLYINNFIRLFLIMVIFNIIAVLLNYPVSFIVIRLSVSWQTKSMLITWLPQLIRFIPSTFATGLILIILAMKYLDKPVSVRYIFPDILRILFPLMLLVLLYALVLWVGFILLLVPGFIFWAGFSCSTSVMVVEKQKVIGSMKRSWRLTKGSRLRIFGILLFVLLVTFGLNWVLGRLLLVLYTIPVILEQPILLSIFSIIGSSLIGPFSSCVAILIYFNMRIKKEGFDIEHLAWNFSLEDEYGQA